jgi:2-oxoglutarate dehydrogenase complex dehydrogenase (E1) component-like enzyme
VGKTYRLEISYIPTPKLYKWILRARDILTKAEGNNREKERAWKRLARATTFEEYLAELDNPMLDYATKLRLKEIL